MRRLLLVGLVALLAGCGAHVSPASMPPPSPGPTTAQIRTDGSVVRAGLTGSQPVCGRTMAQPPTYQHVVWIWLENRSYDEVIGPAPARRRVDQLPYLNRLAEACGLATNYHNVSHPSQPNYFAAVAGTTGGVTANCESWSCPLGDRQTLFTPAHGEVAGSSARTRSPCPSLATAAMPGGTSIATTRRSTSPRTRGSAAPWDIPLGTEPRRSARHGPEHRQPASVQLHHAQHLL